ncbi:glycosyltransferase family 1 protein [Vibrio parahaemolyticus]|uniref:glycosyltransferase family 4 protein n=2 Tax=Vibrio parahaemolyticus TaxID=670 RepID=UPI001124663C|nr:glycosyltransferase family 4 protein [Vibrio parahaemolyticus]EGQ9240819.1 glycosyltransferase family 4 protein [Vibrio parahaemolyticus]EGR1898434.1 glycosyltransferase family 1 protein [Vibrio parahaemolyticus]EGR1918343.1 glycosyltransferase family 1 protein [Vibrio parahaemolyticus]EJF7263905.1 glycosyltransferase family 4 protein [Vibrio parahaemolyticus]TOH62602.1 glycosyl transferase family 1 [Vibrio parahaemolyticus]
MKLISNNPDLPIVGEVWIFVDSRIFGGIESHILELAKGILAFGHAVRIVLPTEYTPQAQLVEKAQAANIPTSYLPQISGVPSNTIAIKHLTSAVAHHQPSVLHTHGYKASILARTAKLLTRTFPRLVSTYHAGESSSGKLWLYDGLDRCSGYLSDHCFAVSKSIQDKVLCPSQLLNNFVALPSMNNHYQEISFVGRLSHEKGADQFIELAKACPDYRFSIYGDGPERQNLETTAPENVIFHGHQTDMNAVWENISVLIISSRFEGLPMAALEAMARGIVVISLKVGRLPDIIQSGNNGFIADDVPALALNLQYWMTMEKSQQERIRKNARQTIVEQFSTESVIPVLLTQYQIEMDN